jgi:DNA processing protein
LNELEALVQLAAAPHLGSIKIRLLIHHFGSAEAALHADLQEIAQFPGFGEKIVESIRQARSGDFARREIELAERQGVHLVPYTSTEYPKSLLEIHDRPVILYVKGQIKASDRQSIAVVGTRRMSVYGGEMAEKLSRELAAEQFTVVSGLARGIDTCAHRGALRSGRTIAVIGSGLGDIYPQENSALAEQIATNGALVSEFPMMTPPDRQNFPQRNRIVSGMTLGTLLIEAPIKSGAMITMEKALAQHKKLFALPGRVDSENFRGNHQLIKSGLAQLVEEARDVTGSFTNLFSPAELKTKWAPAKPHLEREEAQLLELLPDQELSFDQIVQLSKLPVMKVNVTLMSLMLKKVIKEFPGKIYKKVL